MCTCKDGWIFILALFFCPLTNKKKTWPISGQFDPMVSNFWFICDCAVLNQATCNLSLFRYYSKYWLRVCQHELLASWHWKPLLWICRYSYIYRFFNYFTSKSWSCCYIRIILFPLAWVSTCPCNWDLICQIIFNDLIFIIVK